MVKLRLAKQGRKKLPIYKIIAADSRSRRDGRFIEALGQYRPTNETNKVLDLNEERIMYWLKVGAQPTDTVRSLLSKEGILLKWHLDKKKIEPARAAEIFNTWKENRDSSEERKIVAKKDSARKKKEAEEKAKADALAAAAAPPVVEEAQVAEVVAETPAEAAPVAEVVAEAPAEATPVAKAAVETPAAEAPAAE